MSHRPPNSAVVSIGVGIDTARYGHHVTFLDAEPQQAAPSGSALAWLLVLFISAGGIALGQTSPKKPAAKPPARTSEKKPAAPAARSTKPAAKPAKPTAEAAPATADADAEDDRQRQIVERFLTVLEKNPRRGTALDRIYGHHVERGTLDQLVEKYRARTAKDGGDAAAWMIVGLLESQRGHDAAAVAAFQQAEKAEAKNYLAPYYLGQSLVLVGQPEAAAAAFERAIERKPPPAELLDVFQALGRVYQRAQRNQQALAVWTRLEKLFPNDARVEEQIASTLAEEGEHAEALTRYKKLAQATKDRYRQSLFRMEAGELELKLGQTTQALGDFENMLADLNPDSWLYREVRRRIEEAFLRNDDQAGLAKYYTAWLEKHGDDVDGMARLAHTLATQGRVPEAQTWLEKAIKLAPSRKELRRTFIGQLVYDQRWPEAIAQYEALDKADPNNPDYLREWGQIILRDKSRDETERKKAAADVWRRLTAARPKDPLAATQVADLFRHAEMPDEALEYYRRAVELDPESPQYREYLGEYYHTLKRSDEALATWRAIAAAPNRNAKNLARLAEVLSGFGYLKEAVKTMGEACELENDDFARQLKYADLLGQDRQFDAALAQLDQADKLAENDEEREEVLKGQIKVFEGAERLTAVIDALAKQLEAGDAAAAGWYRLARLREAARQFPEATAAINKSLERDGKSVVALTAAARIEEASGNLLDAAQTYRKLAAIDRRSRTLYLTEVAKLEARLGRRDDALAAGRDLLAAAPGNPEHYEFFAELCFQLGQNDEGLETLRRSLRANPSEPKVLLTLAKALADRFRTDEAIELYWRAFEKAGELEPKLDVVSRLADLYLQTNQFDRLLERLERLRREAKESRELSICVAQAYHSAGDYGTAGQELVRLLSQNPSDTQLLQQLSTLLEAEGDVAEAAKYQQQLVHLAPSKETETRLAMLLARAGATEEAGTIWQHLTEKEEEPEKIFKAIDSLIGSGKRDTALAVTERILREQPNNWEALYREVAVLADDKPQEAAARCRAILALRLNDDEPNAATKAFKGREARKPAGVSARQLSPFAQSLPVQNRAQMSYQIRNATGLQVQQYYGNQPQLWTPGDFGQARMAALGWLLAFAEKEKKQDAFLAEQRAARDEAEKSKNLDRMARTRWDWYYLQSVRQDYPETFAAAKALAEGDDPTGQFVYLASLGNRTVQQNVRVVRNNDDTDNVEPLAADELERMLAAYRNIQQKRPELFEQAGYYGQMIVNNVTTELRRAKRTDEEQQIYRQALAKADQGISIATMLTLSGQRGDMEGTLELLDRLAKQPASRGGGSMVQNYGYNIASPLNRLMGELADAKRYGDILRLYDRYWAYVLQQKRTAARPTAARRSTSVASLPYFTIYVGKTPKNIRVAFPLPNNYFDFNAIQLLRNAYELYKRDDLLSDLVAHLRAAATGDAPAAERIYPQLALAYVQSWEESPREAVDDFARACELAPDDLNLKLDLAELRETNGDLDEALALADAVTPLDQSTMQRRELLALRVAVRSGDLERARQAAERLFGLRLDAEMQVELAAQMRQLGMHDLAEAVMARAQRQAGNRSGALMALMLQYQGQNKPDVAAQVAHQILRRVPGRQRDPNMGQTPDDAARGQAITVLARTGKLKDMIARAEAQLKNSPHSVQIYQTLAEYYQAAGDRKKSAELYQQMAAARPDDARLQYQVAQQLSQSGDPAAAVEHYRAAIKKEPRLFGNNYWQVEQTFRQAKKEEELVKLLEEIDLKAIGQYYMITNLIQNMGRNDNQRPLAMKLFKRAWEAFPAQRAQIISQMYDNTFWETQEAYDYARDALIPRGDAAVPDAWAGVSSVMSFSGDGRVNSLVTRFLDGAAKRNELEPLSAELATAVKKFPQWTSGKLLLGLVEARRGQVAQSRAAIEELLADRRSPMPSYACWVAGQELENRGELNDLAMKLYESTVDSSDVRTNFSYSPLKRLVGIYHKAGRDEDGRALVLKLAKEKDYANYDPNYAAYQQVQNRNSVGQQLLELGYAADAAKIYNELLADSESFELAQQFGGSYLKQQVEQGMAKAMQGLKPDGLRRAVDALLKPAGKEAGDGAAIDLMLMVQPRDLARAELTSMLAGVLKSAGSVPDAQELANSRVKQLVSDHPRDFSVQIAAVLEALAGGKADPISAAVERLQKLVAETPLEELPDGARPNARQRAEAARQIGLWLVARECVKQEPLRDAGDKFAERALQAARRQLDAIYALAMLRERGQAELDRGDHAAAERSWGEMLQLVLPPPAEKKRGSEGASRRVEKASLRAPAHHQGQGRRMKAEGRNPFSTFVILPPAFRAAVAGAAPGRQKPRTFAHGSAAWRCPGADQPGHRLATSLALLSNVDPARLCPSHRLKLAANIAAATLVTYQYIDQAQRPAAPTARPANPATKPVGLPVATLQQFDQAMDIAALAAEHKLHELSLRAVREVLRAGPPAVPMKAMQRGGPGMVVRSRSNQPDNDQSQIAQRVEQRLSRLDALWKRRAAPPEAVYQTLVEAVMPAGRPGEILLYAPPLTVGSLRNPTSAGKLLVDWATRAGCADRLRQRVNGRLEQPLAQLPGYVLLAQLALATGDRQAATASFDWLRQRIAGETLQSSAEMACHAALPALDDGELAPKAVGIVETAAKNLSAQPNQQSNDEPAASLLLLLARHQLRHGAVEAGRKSLLDYLAVCQQMNVRYTGDYGIYRRKQQLAKVATELATAGQFDEALDMLGQYADTEIGSNYGQIDVGPAVVALVRQLASAPAAERYEKLKQWSLPAKDRKSVRLLAAFVPQEELPEAFHDVASASAAAENRSSGGLTKFSNASGDLMSTLTMLVEAAQAGGQLDELAKLAHEAAHDPDQKIENAAALEIVVQLARRRPENVREAATALAAELASTPPAQAWRASGLPGAEYLAANACASNAALGDVGMGMLATLLTHAQQSQNHPLLSHLRIDVADQTARRLGQQRKDRVDELVPWQPALFISASMHRSGAARPWWAVDGRQAVHVGGGESDHFIFDYPLTGTFEITADLLDGMWAEANLGYGGLCVEAYTTGHLDVWPVGHHEQIRRPTASLMRQGSYNHYAIRVSPDAVRFSVNGKPVYRDDAPSSCAPWLDLFSSRERRTAFRNVRITGKPVVPRRVELVKGDRLDGWLAQFYNESQPARIYKGEPNDRSGGYYLFRNVVGPADYDWRAAEGVIHGRRAQGLAPGSSQSRLHYMRPLRDGETLRYEFLYEPDATHVHPALDRLVFLIEPEGVAPHWMTDGETDSTELPADNVAAEPAHRRGPRPLPLKPGEWNAMELRLAAGELSLVLNGGEIYRRPMEASNDRLFSLFHYKDRTAVQVRNVVLSGDDWPSELSEARLANLLLPIDAERNIDPAGLTDALLGEENVYLGTWQVWQTARSLPAAERYLFLRDWVLPDPVRGSVVRLYGNFTPTDPAPPVAESVGVTAPHDQRLRRVSSGGELVVPALDLVAVAAELGKLDELRSLAEARAAGDEFAARGKDALLALIAVATNNDDRAQQVLSALYPHTKNSTKDEAEYRRWSALVAAWAAFERPALRPIALAMLNQIADGSPQTGVRWERTARHLRARALLASMPDGNVSFGSPPPLTQWRTATHATAVSRGSGQPPMHWQHRPGGLMHYAGHDFDYVYFGVPLRGDFELEAELSTFGWREITSSYAASIFGVVYDRKSYTQSTFERGRPNGVIDPPLDDLGHWYRYRLSVKNGQSTAFVNGRQIVTQRLPDEPDPWLVFRSWGLFNAEARQVRITGTPQVPAELRLSAAANLDAWLAEYYGESVAGDGPNWEKRGEEIFGRKLAHTAGTRQSLLQYHRPLFEDGQIDYEFYYQAGEAAVAPAIDRLALLLEPSGVDIHWLSDAQHDRSGLTPDNRATEPQNRRGPAMLPLNDRAWNRVRLTLVGDTVTLQLNGVEVYQRDLEPTNQRVFGLYHDAAQTEARVRNVVYRGDWPKSLPPLAEQELAVSPAVRAALDPKKVVAEFKYDFRGGKPLAAQLSPAGQNAAKYITRPASGARIVLPANQEKPNAVGYETNFRLRGDFEVVAVYSGLKTVSGPKAWGPGIDLQLRLNGSDNADLLFERRQREDGQHVLQSIYARDLPGKLDRPSMLKGNTIAAASGKLKIVRSGPMIYFLFGEYGSDDYRLLSEERAGDADALRVKVYARAFSKQSGVDVVLEELSIRAESFVAPGKAP